MPSGSEANQAYLKLPGCTEANTITNVCS